uniref:G protein gamma domain-containing protein n=1 Tax=Callorhinchus milii TaxID=7868 RepID=A0A4W3IB96_CALMI
ISGDQFTRELDRFVCQIKWKENFERIKVSKSTVNLVNYYKQHNPFKENKTCIIRSICSQTD